MQSSIFQRVLQAQSAYQEDLFRRANVVGVAAGLKNQEDGGEPSIVILVQEKQPFSALSAEDRIPERINGIRTDVMEVGYLEAQAAINPKGRFRPSIPGGVSIGHYKITAGTLGVIVYDLFTGEKLILSNNHVLANSNEALTGDAILQPGPTDGGQNPADKVATLERFIPLHYIEGDVNPPTPDPTPDPSPNPNPRPDPVDPGQPPAGCDIVDVVVSSANALAGLLGSEKRVTATSASEVDKRPTPPSEAFSASSVAITPATAPTVQATTNSVDAALARPIDPTMFSDEITQIGTITSTKPAMLGMRVRKYGRTTSYTESQITLLNATVNVAYSTSKGTRTARFSGQVISGAMSQGGDSGSLVVDATENRAVGLLFAGSSVATIFTPIDLVLNALNVKFLDPEA
ncbi:MAG: hypothetical protein RLP44_24000 [Aggregatilineales bacterium]